MYARKVSATSVRCATSSLIAPMGADGYEISTMKGACKARLWCFPRVALRAVIAGKNVTRDRFLVLQSHHQPSMPRPGPSVLPEAFAMIEGEFSRVSVPQLSFRVRLSLRSSLK